MKKETAREGAGQAQVSRPGEAQISKISRDYSISLLSSKTLERTLLNQGSGQSRVIQVSNSVDVEMLELRMEIRPQSADAKPAQDAQKERAPKHETSRPFPENLNQQISSSFRRASRMPSQLLGS